MLGFIYSIVVAKVGCLLLFVVAVLIVLWCVLAGLVDLCICCLVTFVILIEFFSLLFWVCLMLAAGCCLWCLVVWCCLRVLWLERWFGGWLVGGLIASLLFTISFAWAGCDCGFCRVVVFILVWYCGLLLFNSVDFRFFVF